MKKVKLLAIKLCPIVGIFNENGEMSGEAEAPNFKIYPGNDLTDVIKQLKEQVEKNLPDGPSNLTDFSDKPRGKEKKDLQGLSREMDNRSRTKH